MAWIMGLACSMVGIALGCLMSLWAAKQWPSFDDRLLILAGLMPLFGFMAGFVPIAKMQGQWPLFVRGPRFLIGFAAAVMCAVGMYLSFLMVSYTWNKEMLPPDRRSVTHLIFHPAEIPPVKKVQEARHGGMPAESDETWHVLTIVCFFVGGFAGYAWSGRGG